MHLRDGPGGERLLLQSLSGPQTKLRISFSDQINTVRPEPECLDILTNGNSAESHMVDGCGDLERSQVISGNRTGNDNIHRCVDVRLGRNKLKLQLARQVAPPRVSYKLARVENGLCSPPTTIPVDGKDSSLSDRQFNWHSISPERGRHQVEGANEANREDIASSEEAPCDNNTVTHSRALQRAVGSRVASGSDSSFRVGSSTKIIPVDSATITMGTSSDRRVCEHMQSSTAEILLSLSRSGSGGSGRIAVPVAGT